MHFFHLYSDHISCLSGCFQGYVDEERDINPFSNMFGGGKKKKVNEEKEVQAKEEPAKKPKNNGCWPF